MSDNVLDLTPILKARAARACKHNHADVDMTAASLTCCDCGAELDPWWYLRHLATRPGELEAEEARHDKQIADKMAECNARVEYMNNTLTRLQKEIDKLRAAKSKLVVETAGSSPEYGTTVVVSNRIRRSPKR